MKPILTIAIPTLHNFDQLSAALKSLIVYTDFPFKIVIVNNAPADDEALKARIKATELGDLVSIINMGCNAGWMRAINRVLKDCDTPFFCMMNDDVVFPPGSNLFWRTLTSHFNDPNVAAAGPSSNFIAGCQNLFQLDVPLVIETSLLIGMLMVVDTKVLQDLGGLDESLPGGDDLDLSIRLLSAGKKLICDRTAYVHHIGQQTGRRVEGDDWDSQSHQERTNNALIKKHGVKKWYNTFGAWWAHSSRTVEYLDKKSEGDWLDEILEKYRGNGKIGIDLGCGSGIEDTDGLRQEGLSIIGLDRAKEGEVGAGGRKFTNASPDITADALAIPAGDRSLDFILARHLFEHLVDPLVALGEWRRVLKPGGELIVTVPDHDKMPSMILDCTHVHAYTPRSLQQLLETTDWTVEECESLGWGVVVCNAKP